MEKSYVEVYVFIEHTPWYDLAIHNMPVKHLGAIAKTG